MLTHLEFLPLFEKFIKDSRSGKRLNKNRSRIKPRSVTAYVYCYKLIEEFLLVKNFPLVIYQVKGNNNRQHQHLKRYYSNFYKQFTSFLYRDKNCYDNYVGQNIKQIRTFFGWLNQDKGIITGTYYKNLYVCKEDVPIITLSVKRLQFLAFDAGFESGLSAPLKRSKDIFVFGCIVGLRFSDLLSIKDANIENHEGCYYLKVRSQKTGIDTLVKLPEYALRILDKYKRKKSPSYFVDSPHNRTGKSFLLPSISLVNFNTNLKKLAKLAGWIEAVQKQKTKTGISKEKIHDTRITRFCDVISSHMMRRTSITIMLTSGMPEYIVRKISGHTSNSKAFFRYVNLAQSLMDQEIEKMHKHFEINV